MTSDKLIFLRKKKTQSWKQPLPLGTTVGATFWATCKTNRQIGWLMPTIIAFVLLSYLGMGFAKSNLCSLPPQHPSALLSSTHKEIKIKKEERENKLLLKKHDKIYQTGGQITINLGYQVNLYNCGLGGI